MATIYLDPNEVNSYGSNNSIKGSSGTEVVTLNAGATNVTFNQSVERIALPGLSSAYTFMQAGNSINVYLADVLVFKTPVQADADGTQITFFDGTVNAKLTAGVMTLGGTTVPPTTAVAVTPTTIDTTIVTPGGQPPLPAYTLTPSTATVNEGVAFTYTLTVATAPETDTTVMVSVVTGIYYTDSQGTGSTNTNDFPVGALNPKAVVIKAGETTATFDVTTLDDGISELPEIYTVKAMIGSTTVATKVMTVLDGGLPSDAGKTFQVNGADTAVGTIAGNEAMRLTGDQAVRIDFTNPANQVKGLDLDGDGTIENNGVENNITGVASNFEIVDAYARNRLDETNKTENFLGNIAYDGTGFAGDGVTTDGNIFLGGFGVDTALGGIGNDFLVGGGIANQVLAAALATNGLTADTLSGGRNADFFFVELSRLDNTDQRVNIDGGITADDSVAGNVQTPQDADWLLLEASDDDEPVTVTLQEGNNSGGVASRSGLGVTIRDIENFDASGNLYGFLNNVDVQLGGRGTDSRDPAYVAGAVNNGQGSSAQLIVNGSTVANIIVGGYDNDRITGDDGNDLLMGGNLINLINPNLLTIVNDGMDNLTGSVGDDDIVFEADGGRIEGDLRDNVIDGTQSNSGVAGNDTLWLTSLALGTSTAAVMTTDALHALRFDLDSQNIDQASGYGGANFGTTDGTANDTQDQTLYATGVARTTVQDMENVVATGLGAIDYDTDGSNTGDIAHLSQVNLAAYTGNLTLRGTGGNNTLYASSGTDTLEGRTGNDLLSGGDQKDDFVFQISGQGGTSAGDGIDVIHRQNDTNNNNIWDGTGIDRAAGATADLGTFGQDFGIQGSSIFGPSSLSVDFAGANLADANVFMGSFSLKIGGVTFAVTDLAGLKLIATVADLATFVNTAFQLIDQKVTVTSAGTVLTVTDSTQTATSGGRVFSTTQADGYDVNLTVQAPGAGALTLPAYVPAGATPAPDRLIFAAYEDRLDGELVDDNGMVNHTGDAVTLGGDGYAEDLVVRFNAAGTGSTTIGDTVLAEDQFWTVAFTNLADEDTVSLSVNGTAFALQMGVAADGTAIGETAAQFVARLTSFINSVADANTLAGSLIAANVAGTTTLTLTQGNYGGGQNVFMDSPVVTLGNASGGEAASFLITKTGTNSEITLTDYDGRGGNFTAANVLFVGGSGMDQGAIIGTGMNAQSAAGVDNANSRAVLATAAATGSTLNGSNALVLDTMTDANTLATDFSLHGDDYLIGGAGADTLTGGTGDDRFQGSGGADVVNGGKDLYVVQQLIDGVVVESVETLNTYDAAQRATITIPANAKVINVFRLEEDTATGATDGFTDTLVFNQNDFATPATTNFYITVGRAADTARLQQMAGGEGTVQVGTFNSATSVFTQTLGSTAFAEMEAIRTLAGNGTRAGQGRDTLDVSLISGDVAASFTTPTNANNVVAGVTVNLRSNTSAITVTADTNAIDTDNLPTETIANFLAVAGVENVIGGNANDTVNIDESEVRKDNTFTGGLQTAVTSNTVAGLVGDVMSYDHSDMDNNGIADKTPAQTIVANAAMTVALALAINNDANLNIAGAALAAVGAQTNSANDNVDTVTPIALNPSDPALDTALEVSAAKLAAYNALVAAVQTGLALDASIYAMRPSVNLKVGTTTDLVTMSGGTMLSDSPVDTLNGVEGIDLNDLARSALRDTLDVKDIVGSTINFQLGKVLQGATLLVDIGEMTELENVQASVTGADTVLMADTMTNINAVAWTTDTTPTGGVPATNGSPDWNNSFAFFRGAINTVAVANQGLFDIDFGTGTGASTTDAINYANELDQDIMVVLDLSAAGVDRVVVATDVDAATLAAATDRVDVLRGADMYYAGGTNAKDSGIDLSQHTGNLLTVQFSSNATALNAAAGAGEDVRNIQIVDGSTSIVKQFIDNGLTTADRALITGQAAAITAANTAITAANAAVAAALLTVSPAVPDFRVDDFAAAAQLAAANAQLAAANLQNADFLGNYWNRIEGNNLNETINLTDRESDHAIAMNLKGGANTISYNDDSIGNTLNFDDVLANTLTGVAEQQVLTVNLATSFGDTGLHTITGTVGSQRVDGSKTGNDFLNMTNVANSNSYSIKLNNVEGSGWKGLVTINASDANSDGDYKDAGDTVAVITTVSGYENITGNNANNSYEANTFVNAITGGSGNDAFTVSSFADIVGDTWTAGTGTDTLIVNVVGAAASTGAFTLGTGVADQSGTVGGVETIFFGFENVDASAATVTAYTMTGRTNAVSVLRGGSANDSLTSNFGGSVLDGGAGADALLILLPSTRIVYEAGDSDSASKDTVTNFVSGADTVEVRVDMAARGLTNVTTAFGKGATPVANSGSVKAFYDTTTSNLLVDMDANGSFSLTGDLTIGGLPGTIVETDMQYDILGTAAANVITGGAEVDRIRGGQGADVMKGGEKVAVGETQSFVLDGQGLDAAQTLTIDGVTITQGATVFGTVVGSGSASALADAFVRTWSNNPAAFANVANLQSVTFDALTNSLNFNFKSTVGNVPAGAIGVATGTMAPLPTVTDNAVAFSAAAASNDVFVVVGSVDATAVEVYRGKYSSQEALNADLNGANLVNLATDLLTVHTTSDAAAGDVYDGGLLGGVDTLHVYGAVDLSTSTLINVGLVVHSSVQLTAAQLAALSAQGATIVFDAQGVAKLVISGLTPTSNIDLSGLNLAGVDRIELSGLTTFTGTITFTPGGGFDVAKVYLGTSTTAATLAVTQVLQEVTVAVADGANAAVSFTADDLADGTYSLVDTPVNLAAAAVSPGVSLGAVDITTITTVATAAETATLLANPNSGSTVVHAATATGAQAEAFVFTTINNDTINALTVTGAVTGLNAVAIQADITAGDVKAVTFEPGAGGIAVDLTGLTAVTTVTSGTGNDTVNLGAGAATFKFAATAATNGVDTITGFTSGTDKLNLDNLGTAISAKPTGAAVAYTAAADTVLYFKSAVAGDADGDVAAVAFMNANSAYTDTAATFYVVIADNNSSALYQVLGNAGGNEFTGDTLTLMGTVDGVVLTSDLLFS